MSSTRYEQSDFKYLKHTVNFCRCPLQEGRTALYVSTERGKVDVVRLLVNAGADPLIKDKVSFTILSPTTLF